jgi:hypothetical protein
MQYWSAVLVSSIDSNGYVNNYAHNANKMVTIQQVGNGFQKIKQCSVTFDEVNSSLLIFWALSTKHGR